MLSLSFFWYRFSWCILRKSVIALEAASFGQKDDPSKTCFQRVLQRHSTPQATTWKESCCQCRRTVVEIGCGREISSKVKREVWSKKRVKSVCHIGYLSGQDHKKCSSDSIAPHSIHLSSVIVLDMILCSRKCVGSLEWSGNFINPQ